MNKSEFWACLKCGVFLRGSHYEILEQSKNHQALCAENSTERENIQKIIKGLQEFSSILPPPPPPPISKDFFERKISTMKKRANISDKSVVQNENIAANDPRLKMPVSVVDGLKKFFKEGKLKRVSERLPEFSRNSKPKEDFPKVGSKNDMGNAKPLKRLQNKILNFKH